jgi:hypothetical protein
LLEEQEMSRQSLRTGLTPINAFVALSAAILLLIVYSFQIHPRYLNTVSDWRIEEPVYSVMDATIEAVKLGAALPLFASPPDYTIVDTRCLNRDTILVEFQRAYKTPKPFVETLFFVKFVRNGTVFVPIKPSIPLEFNMKHTNQDRAHAVANILRFRSQQAGLNQVRDRFQGVKLELSVAYLMNHWQVWIHFIPRYTDGHVSYSLSDDFQILR